MSFFNLILIFLFLSPVFAQEDIQLLNSYQNEAEAMKDKIDLYTEGATESQIKDAVETTIKGLSILTDPEKLTDCKNENEQKALQKKFILVGVSGFMTEENGKGQPSGAHDNLPTNLLQITETHKLVHFTKDNKLEEIIKSLNCGTENQPKRPGLIIMVNSWGSEVGYKLAEKYSKACKEPVEAFVFVDGIGKPMYAYNKVPKSKKCINYFQTKSFVHGKALEKCENIDLSQTCSKGGIARCHIEVEWRGSEEGALKIKELVNGN